MHKIVLVLFILSSSLAWSSERRDKILDIIKEEIQEVNKISNQAGGNNPSLLLKKAELLLEKGRLELEAENEKYLSLSPQTRSRVSKERYFTQSKRSFQQARVVCQRIIREHPGYEYIGDVYFILAYYSKELGDYKNALRNFNKARVSSKKEKVRLKSEIAMAEIFYSINQCPRAIKLYRGAISRMNDKWKTKDLYNYGWCLYKSGQPEAAIEALKESHFLSQKPQYIDMGSRIERDIIIFYVSANKLNEGLRFINKSGRDKEQAINELIKRLKDGGDFKQAEQLLIKLAEISPADQKAKYYLMLYKLYENIDWKKSSRVAIELKKSQLSQNQLIEARNLALRKMSYVQALLVRSKKESASSKLLMAATVEANGILAMGDKPQDNFKIYLAIAESYSLARRNQKAFAYYMKSLEDAKRLQSRNFQKISLEGALKVVSNNNLNDLEKVYSEYLKFAPKVPKSAQIYEKLFQVYMKQGKDEQALNLVKQYQQNFPRNIKQREAMLALLFKSYDQKKQSQKTQSLLSQIQSGKIAVTPLYKQRLVNLSNSLLEKDAARLIQSGDWKQAVEKYKLAFSQNSNNTTKADIALNIAQLYDSQKNYPESKTWTQKSVKLMSSTQVTKSQNILNTLNQNLFYSGYITQSAQISRDAWLKACRQLKLFKNTMILVKASEMNAKALFQRAYRCLPRVEVNKIQRSFYDNSTQQVSQTELAKLKNMKSLERHIVGTKLSSNIDTFSTQIKSTLSKLTRLNNLLSTINSNAQEKIQGFYSLLYAYASAEKKVKDYINNTKVAEVKASLKPVLLNLTNQKKEIFKKSLSHISKFKNYTPYNHDLLQFLGIGSGTSYRRKL